MLPSSSVVDFYFIDYSVVVSFVIIGDPI